MLKTILTLLAQIKAAVRAGFSPSESEAYFLSVLFARTGSQFYFNTDFTPKLELVKIFPFPFSRSSITYFLRKFCSPKNTKCFFLKIIFSYFSFSQAFQIVFFPPPVPPPDISLSFLHLFTQLLSLNRDFDGEPLKLRSPGVSKSVPPRDNTVFNVITPLGLWPQLAPRCVGCVPLCGLDL